MTKKERKHITAFTAHWLKISYWLDESGNPKRNREQRQASFRELVMERDISNKILLQFTSSIKQGMKEWIN